MAIQSNINDSVELEETNLENSTTPDQLLDPVKKNLMYIGAAVVVVLLGVFGIMYYKGSVKEKQADAALALAAIQPAYETGDYEQALNGNPTATFGGKRVDGLTTIAKSYEGTEPGKLASLYAGNALAAQGKYSEAEQYYTIAADASAELTRIGGMAGLASVKDKAGQYKEAAELYKKAADLAEKIGNKELYQLSAALLYEKVNAKDEAVQIYREILATNEFSEFAGEAKAGLLRLGQSIE